MQMLDSDSDFKESHCWNLAAYKLVINATQPHKILSNTTLYLPISEEDCTMPMLSFNHRTTAPAMATEP